MQHRSAHDDDESERTEANRLVFRNSQWCVTADGFLSARWCGYHIDPDGLDGSGLGRSWHTHVAAKTWIDVDQFAEAFRAAVKFNALPIEDAQMQAWETEARAYVRDRIDPRPRYDENDDDHYGHWWGQ